MSKNAIISVKIQVSNLETQKLRNRKPKKCHVSYIEIAIRKSV